MINYNKLYYTKEIEVQDEQGKIITCFVQLNDLQGVPDCQIGNFYHNFYFRTNAGIKKKKYKNRKNLEREVKKLLEKNGFKVLGWIPNN